MFIFSSPKELPFLFRLYPSFSLTRLMYRLSDICGDFKCISSFSELDSEMQSCLTILYISAFVFFVLGLYLDEVVPQEYGIPKHPLYFLKKSSFKKKIVPQKNSINNSPQVDGKPFEQIDIKRPNLYQEDADVKREREYISIIDPNSTTYPLIIRNLRKVYKPVGGKPSKVAVKDFSLHVTHGQMFGLLGPNGAGKTSLIAMLTGLYPPDGGSAWIGGYSILADIDKVHTQMGVCPQFDLLWPDLTVEEHLLFYARIRGVSKQDEKRVVEKAIREVYLTQFAKFSPKSLSGKLAQCYIVRTQQ